MGRYFNTEGLCRPDKHYMVRLDDRLDEIKRLLVDREKYFVINRGRQYGKTTTMWALKNYLEKEYFVLALDFQGIGTEEFADASTFSHAFASVILESIADAEITGKDIAMHSLKEFAESGKKRSQRELFLCLSRMCAAIQSPVVLMIDEVDSASNNQVFIEFLAMLRQYYLKKDDTPIFHAVILAGVYDIRNLKLKLRPDTEHQYNSPWNIAAEFNIKMDFSAEQIASMLEEYEADKHTGMDIMEIAGEIARYTSGYPYLVSAICKLLDEELSGRQEYADSMTRAWTKQGVAEAVKLLLGKRTTLFDSLARHMDDYPDMRKMTEQILYQGRRIPFDPDVHAISLGMMFGYLREQDGQVVVANRIFEMRLLNRFISEEALNSEDYRFGQLYANRFTEGGRLNMKLVLEKFVIHFTDIYGADNEKFIEEQGRKFFLLYLKPIINGTGNYYMEAQTRDAKRTDVIVDYLGEQFIIELKIWHGEEYNERGEAQLTDYMEYYHTDTGYMLSFNFNQKKEIGIKEIRIGNKTIIEAVV